MEHSGRRVQQMFSSIARRYDFLNHLLSLGIDRRWRRRLAAALPAAAEAGYLDVATGTGDVALAVSRRFSASARVVGIDFSLPMLLRGKEKIGRRTSREKIRLVYGDALQLPFPRAAFDGITIAFGLRNLSDPLLGLREMTRVLKPGGRLVILEFATPGRSWLRRFYLFYFLHLLPWVGGVISGNSQAYRYLPASVLEFPEREALENLLRKAGLKEVGYRDLTGGIAVLYSGAKGGTEG